MSTGPGQREVLGRDLREPERDRWADNGRVEVVVDPNWMIDGKPRVVRRVGWRNCFCCKRRMFSPDIHKVRICDQCKDVKTDMSCGVRRILPRAKRPRGNSLRPAEPHGPVAGESVRLQITPAVAALNARRL